MLSDVLISPLGRSPGAVSGVYFALKADYPEFAPEKIITVGTSDPGVLCVAHDYLKKLFDHCGVMYEPIHVPAHDLRGGSQEIMPYVAMLGVALEQAHREGSRVHVAVTAGRSGMGALAALATNLYGADHLWHLWVARNIEEMGLVNKLPELVDGPSMERAPALNPTVGGKEAYELVDLPFVDLRPLHEVLLRYLRTGEVPDPKSPLAALFNRMGIETLKQVFPAGITIADADEILKLKAHYAQATPAEQGQIMVDLGRLLQRVGVVSQSEAADLIKLINGNAAPDALIALAKGVQKDRLGFWASLLKWFEERLKWLGEHKDAADSTEKIGGLFFTGLELYLKFKGLIS